MRHLRLAATRARALRGRRHNLRRRRHPHSSRPQEPPRLPPSPQRGDDTRLPAHARLRVVPGQRRPLLPVRGRDEQDVHGELADLVERPVRGRTSHVLPDGAGDLDRHGAAVVHRRPVCACTRTSARSPRTATTKWSSAFGFNVRWTRHPEADGRATRSHSLDAGRRRDAVPGLVPGHRNARS